MSNYFTSNKTIFANNFTLIFKNEKQQEKNEKMIKDRTMALLAYLITLSVILIVGITITFLNNSEATQNSFECLKILEYLAISFLIVSYILFFIKFKYEIVYPALLCFSQVVSI